VKNDGSKRMKKWYLGVLAACVVMLLGTGTASAVRSIPTTIVFDGATPVGDGSYVYSGHLRSPRDRCVLLRLVELLDGRNALDLDLTSFFGAWGMRANPDGANLLKAKVVPEKFGNRHHRKVCEPDAVTFPAVP
jgi:hypothetical protein